VIGDCISDCMYMDAPSTRLQGEMRQPSTELENCACGVRESECGLDRIHGSMQWHAQTRCVPVSMDCMVGGVVRHCRIIQNTTSVHAHERVMSETDPPPPVVKER